MSDPAAHRPLDVDTLLTDPKTRIIVCCGSGGVGKTTTAAALALRAAESGRRTVVITIDPARRLAQSLGLTELDNTPRRVTVNGVGPANGTDPAEHSDENSGGELHAMMLDMKRTFDEIVEEHTTAAKAEEIFANPFYQAMSSTFGGTQEYMAMEKLGQLRASDQWDLIVLDTPPSRSALDFLDAPQHLATFLDGKMLRLILAPARVGGRGMFKMMTASLSFFSRAITKVLGAQLITELSTFVGALDSMFGGFRERAEQTYALLQTSGTAFLVVATPEQDAIREAAYFADRLTADRMPLAGLVLNRTHRLAADQLTAEAATTAADALEADGESPATVRALRIHADLVTTVERQQAVGARFTAAHPDVPMVTVPARASDIHDLDGLRRIGADLAAH